MVFGLICLASSCPLDLLQRDDVGYWPCGGRELAARAQRGSGQIGKVGLGSSAPCLCLSQGLRAVICEDYKRKIPSRRGEKNVKPNPTHLT